MTRLSLLLLCLATGCSPFAVPQGKVPAVIYLDNDGDAGGEAWHRDFQLHFYRDCKVIDCHGGDDGYWVLCPKKPYRHVPVEELAWILHQLEPQTLWLFIVCNPGHYELHVPNCFYAKRNVWNWPGFNWRIFSRTGEWEDFVGRAAEFEEGKQGK